MAAPRLSTFIIGLIWLSVIAVAFGSFISSIAVNYGVVDAESNLSAYQKMEDLNTMVETYKAEITQPEEKDASFTDILGTYFSSGYQALITTTSSLDLFSTMLDDSADQLNLGVGGVTVKQALVSSIAILVVIGILLSALIKREM